MSAAPTVVGAIPRLALRREEAAGALGVSVDHFDGHVRHQLRSVRVGRVTLYPTREIVAWLEKNAATALGDER